MAVYPYEQSEYGMIAKPKRSHVEDAPEKSICEERFLQITFQHCLTECFQFWKAKEKRKQLIDETLDARLRERRV
jgi:hypothetical protein